MPDYAQLADQVAKIASVEESAATVISTIGADLAALRARLASQGSDTTAVADMQSKLAAATGKLAAAIAAIPVNAADAAGGDGEATKTPSVEGSNGASPAPASDTNATSA